MVVLSGMIAMSNTVQYEKKAKTVLSGNNVTQATSSLKIGLLNVHVTSRFYPKKLLPDIMYSIASTRLKENPE